MLQKIKTDFLFTRNLSEELCQGLEKEDFVVQTIFDVSPIKWHLGHTTWFFETLVLKAYKKNYQEFHPKYNYVFNSYYNSIGDRVAKDIRGLLSRPTVDDIYAYRTYVTNEVFELLASMEEIEPKLALLMNIGINHEQQHQELIIYDIKHIYFLNPLNIPYTEDKRESKVSTKPLEFISIDEGIYKIGTQNEVFSYDNEFPRHKTYLGSYKLANRLITNAEYLDFVNDNAYQSHHLWLDDAWALMNQEKWEKPLYWEKRDGEWWEWTLYSWRKLNLSEPLSHISFYEANAFASWAGKRLPTEAEWEVAAEKELHGKTAKGNFLDQRHFHVLDYIDEPYSIQQLFGSVWEWTSSAYQAHPGYKRPKGAIGEYNSKFMSGQMILKGGSYATLNAHFRPSYRNFFQAEKRWLISGIRLAEDA